MVCKKCGKEEFTWQQQGGEYKKVKFKPSSKAKSFTCCMCLLTDWVLPVPVVVEEYRPVLRRRIS